MRYSVFFKKADGEKTCVFNTTSPDLMLALMNPKVHLAADSAGTFECSLNPNSPAMSEDILERMATKVMIEEYKGHVPNDYLTGPGDEGYATEKAEHDANGEKVLFYGRLLSISKDFYNTPSLYCEGALSFLNDTVIMPYTMPKKNADQSYFTPKQALIKFLTEHNIAVGHQNPNAIKFELNPDEMIVTMKDDLFSGDKNDGSGEEIDNFRITTYTNTLEVLNNLKKTYGGHFRVRYRKVTPADRDSSLLNTHPEKYYGSQMAIPILDWIADHVDVENQGSDLPDANTYIKFGKNLLDLTQKTDGANIVNCLFLTGKKIASADAEVIGDEIDVAPMCYYWMVRDNGPGIDGTLVTSNQNAEETATNRHDLRFFINVKEGALYRNPRTLAELQAIGDHDMSHVYHITTDPTESNNTWWFWNPTDTSGGGGYKKVSDDKSGNSYYSGYGVITDDDYINGNVLRMSGNITDNAVYDASLTTIIYDAWTASSRGLAWAQGCVINSVSSNEASYVYYGASGDPVRTDYSSTGFWDANLYRPAWVGTGPDSSLRVDSGETFYVTCGGFSDPNISLTTILTVTTQGTLGYNDGQYTYKLLSKSTANSTIGTNNKYTKITIPTPQDDQYYKCLNISSKTEVSVNIDGSGKMPYPSTREQLNMQLWRTRKTNKDEYVTLYGIADGENRWFLDSEKYVDNGKEKSRTVLRIPKRVSQLMIGVTDDEKWFVYPPKSSDWFEFAYDSSSDFPNVSSIVSTFPDDKYWTDTVNHTGLKVFFIAKDNGYVWQLSDDNSVYTGISPLVARAYKVNSYGVEDPVSIAKYGRIEKIVNFSNCTDPATLRDLGAKKLFEAKLEGLELDVTALDLSLLENNVESPDIFDMIQIQSTPHHVGIEDPSDPTEQPISLPLSERDIPLNDPSQQQYTIGYTGTRKITRTYDWVRK